MYSKNQQDNTNDISGMGYNVYLPLKNSKQDPTRLKRHLIKKLKQNEIELLQKEFKTAEFSEQFINEFFEKEYHAILNWLLIDSKNNSSFPFILKVFPHKALQDKLKKDNFYLTKFLNSRAGMEELGLLTPELRELDKERFKLLLEIDSETIKKFMKENKNANFMKPSTWQDYEMVLQSFPDQRNLFST